MQLGGSAPVLQNLSITQCDAVCKLANIRPLADDPARALNGKVHASGACVLLFRVVRDGCDQARRLRLSPVMGPFGVPN
jgi:hypothetical protein